MVPSSTYRVQLNKGFTFEDAARIAEYLSSLGVSHLYCSPYFQAVPGSTHGYDVADPHRFNEELGGAAAHASLVGALRQAGLGQVLDIVPNHMAADAKSNRWWWDVLENGPSSPYARYFDIDWEAADERSSYTVLVPILGDQYGRALEKGELTIVRTGGTFVVRYFGHELPVSPKTVDEVLGRAARLSGSAELADISEGVRSLPPARVTDRAGVQERHDRKIELARQLSELCERDTGVARAVEDEVREVNSDPDRLDELLRRQNYRVAYWRIASEEIDYRRFFNIESLIGVRVDDPDVFADTHRLIIQLVEDGTLDGLRVDHVDGLRDPEGYTVRLRERTGGVYTVVEKILQTDDEVPRAWPVAGTSGYDFLIRINNLFVATENEAAMTTAYHDFAGDIEPWPEVVHAAKMHVMREDLAAEVERQTTLLAQICERHRRDRDHTRRELRDAVREMVSHYTVYRTYVRPGHPVRHEDRRQVERALDETRERRPDLDGELLVFLSELALGLHDGDAEHEFCERLQQLTTPVMAKGVEDTAFYRYNRLVSLNEVGGDPGAFGRSVADFHETTARLARAWPETMLTLSTHDTKRSGDVRARLNVISEIPGEWSQAVWRWAEIADGYRRDGWSDRNAEYLLYQTLVGAWPLDVDRAVSFMLKAEREAKVRTSWSDPDPEYETGLETVVRGLLGDGRFRSDIERFLDTHALIKRGRRNSLAQTAFLLTCPGVPDIYQGTELWDLSLVDPDNRRVVDFDSRIRLLSEIKSGAIGELSLDEAAGASKLGMIHRLLQYRRDNPNCFQSTMYEPLRCEGPSSEAVVAYDRGGVAVIAPVRATSDVARTTVDIPIGEWRHLLTGDRWSGGTNDVGSLWARFPVAVLAREDS